MDATASTKYSTVSAFRVNIPILLSLSAPASRARSSRSFLGIAKCVAKWSRSPLSPSLASRALVVGYFLISDFFQHHHRHRQHNHRPCNTCTGRCRNTNGITYTNGITIHDDININGQNTSVAAMYTHQHIPTMYTYNKLSQLN